jgi:hypothetical protein
MPIKGRIDMLAAGIRTPVGVKVFGPDLKEVSRIGQEIEKHVGMVPGRSGRASSARLRARYCPVRSAVRSTARSQPGATRTSAAGISGCSIPNRRCLLLTTDPISPTRRCPWEGAASRGETKSLPVA